MDASRNRIWHLDLTGEVSMDEVSITGFRFLTETNVYIQHDSILQ